VVRRKIKGLKDLLPFNFLEQISTLKELEWRWKEMSTKKTSKSEVAELFNLFNELYRGQPWFYGAYIATDDLGPHIDLHVDTKLMQEDGFTIPGAPSGVKTCIFNSPRRKVVV
jgi:hypothetical protein